MLTLPLYALVVAFFLDCLRQTQASPLDRHEISPSNARRKYEAELARYHPRTATGRKSSKGPRHRSVASWSSPQVFTDLSAFRVTKFADGMKNLYLVNIAKGSSPSPTSAQTAYPQNPQTILQLQYPAGSINPGNDAHPTGGVDFYASPLDISQAQSVTLEYSVFFPANFSWVLGGKLPGLYGGHDGCSGGNAAEDCFSTRLMWRPEGAGELYLYAPKTKQGPSVCQTPPSCDCNPAYGLSIGRGSFYFTPGAWTTVRQTVVLNTPGVADGIFQLQVNGKTVMNVKGVYYRGGPGVSRARTRSSSTSKRRSRTKPTYRHHKEERLRRQKRLPIGQPLELLFTAPASPVISRPHYNIASAPPGFVGFFFSSFFGGHEDNYATPTDQRTFFRDMSIWINA